MEIGDRVVKWEGEERGGYLREKTLRISNLWGPRWRGEWRNSLLRI